MRCYFSTKSNIMFMLQLAARRRLPHFARAYATTSTPQTLVEKIVQKYAVDLPAGTKVRSGDYVMIRPEHVYVRRKLW